MLADSSEYFSEMERIIFYKSAIAGLNIYITEFR